MTRVVFVSAQYAAPADAVFEEALDFGKMIDATSGFARYEGLPREVIREGATYTTDITLFGLLRNPGYEIHAETVDRQARVLQSREKSQAGVTWDHRLTVRPEGAGCVWTDEVTITADKLEAITAFIARSMYKLRHKRRGAARLEARITPL